jgi:hypothetical protein
MRSKRERIFCAIVPGKGLMTTSVIIMMNKWAILLATAGIK